MSLIYKNINCIIKEVPGGKKSNDKDYELNIKWEKKSKVFWVNLPFYLFNVVDIVKSNTNRIFKLKQSNICILGDYIKNNNLDYNSCLTLLLNLGNQLSTLWGFGLSVSHININDIVVIEKNDKLTFVYLNDENVYTIKNNKIEIRKIYNKKSDDFLSPEFKNIKSIPIKINHKTSLYSLAHITIYCMNKSDIIGVGNDVLNITGTDVNKNTLLINLLDPIKNTKLYWILMRMLKIDPIERNYLVI